MEWEQIGQNYIRRSSTPGEKILPVGVYVVLHNDKYGLFLQKRHDSYSFDHKIYDLDQQIVSRTVQTFRKINKNMGVFLYGLKGTGKSVAAKMICNLLKIPIIVVPSLYGGLGIFLNSIDQDVVVFIDEFEKIYDKRASDQLLSLMDGSMEGDGGKKLFLLTSNSYDVNDALLSRPGRIRYSKSYSNLSKATILEIVDDLLVDKTHREDVVKFISRLSLITIDIVKSIIEEVNLYNEPPANFEAFFNVSKLVPLYNARIRDGETENIVRNVSQSDAVYDESDVGNEIYVKGHYYGLVDEVITPHEVLVRRDIQEKIRIKFELAGEGLHPSFSS